MSFDLIIRGGDVIDGTGAAARRADVGVSGDRIQTVSDLSGAEGAEVIDAAGQVVTPGFIDTHAHTDLVSTLPESETAIRNASLLQGCTTEVCGNCGFTPFPHEPERAGDFALHLGGLFGKGLDGFKTFGEYRAHIDALDKPVNLAPLVGHGSIRAGVVGMDDRAPTAEELDRMRAAVDAAFDEGAFGLSSGLIYPPAVYAKTEEVASLNEITGKYGRVYATHMRDEADRIVAAIEEALRIGREGNTPVHISHHKLAGRNNWGRSAETLALIDKARQEGVDVTIDVYPYTAGSTYLAAALPPWANAGGPEALMDRLRDSDTRARIGKEVAEGSDEWQAFVDKVGWESVVMATAPGTPEYEGKSMVEVGEAMGTDPFNAACEVLLANQGKPLMIIHMMEESDVQAILSAPFAMIGSDGVPVPGKPHPRLAGTFGRVLGHYCRHHKLFDLPEAVRKMTSFPAARFGLTDRGVIAEGKAADLVVFDPTTVIDKATYDDPLLAPVGIGAVVVNGKVAVRAGTAVLGSAGRVLRP